MFDGATCTDTAVDSSNTVVTGTCNDVIDADILNEGSGVGGIGPAFIVKLTEIQTVRTVFVGN